MNLDKYHCVITGVSGATGSAIRTLLLEHGVTVIGIKRPGQATAKLEKLGSRDYQIGMDLSDLTTIQSAIQSIIGELEQIHVWINVVGAFEMGQSIEAFSGEDWDRMYSMNFITALNSTQAILPHFKQHQMGRLINFGSAAVAKGMAQAGPYLVSKAAVHALTTATAAELENDITCNAILPGIIDTLVNREAMPDADTSAWVKPEIIANQVLELINNSHNGELIQL